MAEVTTHPLRSNMLNALGLFISSGTKLCWFMCLLKG